MQQQYISIWFWIYSALATIFLALTVWSLGAGLRNRSFDREKYQNVFVFGSIAIFIALFAILEYIDGLDKVERIRNDPKLSQLATTAEAIAWIDREIIPLVDKQNEIADQMEKLVIQYEELGRKIKKSEEAYEVRFGRSLSSTNASGNVSSPP